MKEITLDQAIKMVDAAIAERGEDYVYPYATCSYVHFAGNAKRLRSDMGGDLTDITETEPGCGIGLALVRAEILSIEDFDGKYNGRTVADIVPLLREKDILLSGDAFAYLARFQYEQDGGATWSEARAEARDELGITA